MQFAMVAGMDDEIKNFAEARKTAGLSYAQAGAEMGVAGSTIQRWESKGSVRSGSAKAAMRSFIERIDSRKTETGLKASA